MKNLIAFFVLICFGLFNAYSLTNGQDNSTDSTATIVSHWKNGEKINLTIMKQQTKHQANQLVSNESSTYEATITVLDSTEAGYTLEWVYHNFKLKNPNTHPIVEGMIKLSEAMKVKYATNKLGAFTSLLNWQEIQEISFKKIDHILGKFNDPQAMTISNQAKSIFNSKQSIELVVIKDVRLYHSLYGSTEYKLNEVLEIATKTPNILGGDPFPASLTIEMVDLKPGENYCKIRTFKTLDQEKATKIIFDSLRKMAKESGIAEPTEKDLPLMTITETNEFEADLKSGWLIRAYNENEVQSGNRKQTDSYEIKLRK